MKNSFLLILLSFVFLSASAQQSGGKLPKLILRFDDIGMNHSTDMAIEAISKTGIPFSTSVMFACPWYQEAVEILKKHSNADVGVHLTLTAEWKNYKWGPASGRSVVPSLVDKNGFFWASDEEFLKSGYKPEEVEIELTAQIERALASGVKISYIDPHMGIALSTPKLRAITEKLARKYHLGISTLSTVTYFGEKYNDMWGEPVATKKQVFMKLVSNLNPDQLNMVVLHTAVSSPEMDAMVDMNSSMMGTNASVHRQTELNMVLSPDFQNLVNKKFKLTTYRELIKERGLKNMKPVTVK